MAQKTKPGARGDAARLGMLFASRLTVPKIAAPGARRKHNSRRGSGFGANG
jgi:hypothetical protein